MRVLNQFERIHRFKAAMQQKNTAAPSHTHECNTFCDVWKRAECAKIDSKQPLAVFCTRCIHELGQCFKEWKLVGIHVANNQTYHDRFVNDDFHLWFAYHLLSFARSQKPTKHFTVTMLRWICFCIELLPVCVCAFLWPLKTICEVETDRKPIRLVIKRNMETRIKWLFFLHPVCLKSRKRSKKKNELEMKCDSDLHSKWISIHLIQKMTFEYHFDIIQFIFRHAHKDTVCLAGPFQKTSKTPWEFATSEKKRQRLLNVSLLNKTVTGFV